jgi:hypothetical protein
MVSEQQGIKLAKKFVAEQGLDCGAMTSIRLVHDLPRKNVARNVVSDEERYYLVEFAYSCPPIELKPGEFSYPPQDHPTIIWIDGPTGNARLTRFNLEFARPWPNSAKSVR